MIRMKCLALLLALALPLLAQEDTVGKHPEADPARPTITNPAHIPPSGYLQFEQGVQILADSPNDDTSRIKHQININNTTKLALNKRLMIFVQNEPIAHTSYTPDAPTTNDTGDVLVGGQVVFVDFKHGHGTIPSISGAYNRRVRLGTAPNSDLGGTVQGVTLLAGGSGFKLHYDTNVIFNETQGNGPQRRLQTIETIAVSYDLTKSISATLELWHGTQPLTHGHAAGDLHVITYTPMSNIVFDAGFNHGLTSTSSQWTGFFGVTYLLPHRLWNPPAK